MISRIESGLFIVRSALEGAQQRVDATTAEYLGRVLGDAPELVYNVDLEERPGLTVFQEQQLVRLRGLAEPLSQMAILGIPEIPTSDQNYRQPNPILGELFFTSAQVSRGTTRGWRREIDVTVPLRCVTKIQVPPRP